MADETKRKIFTHQNTSLIGDGIRSGARVAAKKYNLDVARQNKRLSEMYSLDAYRSAKRVSNRVISQQIANRGASGLQMMGSTEAIIRQSIEQGELEASSERWKQQLNAIQYGNQAKLERTGAISSLASGLFDSYARRKAYEIEEKGE